MKNKLKFDAVIVTLIVMLLAIVVILVIESPKPEKSVKADVGQGFKGTYVLGQQESDDAEYYVIMDQQEGNVYGFYTNTTSMTERKYRKTNKDCLALLDEDQNIIATMVEAEGTFYLIKNGEEAAELTKLSDVPTIKTVED